jgi:hypothetical protein
MNEPAERKQTKPAEGGVRPGRSRPAAVVRDRPAAPDSRRPPNALGPFIPEAAE